MFSWFVLLFMKNFSTNFLKNMISLIMEILEGKRYLLAKSFFHLLKSYYKFKFLLMLQSKIYTLINIQKRVFSKFKVYISDMILNLFYYIINILIKDLFNLTNNFKKSKSLRKFLIVNFLLIWIILDFILNIYSYKFLVKKHYSLQLKVLSGIEFLRSLLYCIISNYFLEYIFILCISHNVRIHLLSIEEEKNVFLYKEAILIFYNLFRLLLSPLIYMLGRYSLDLRSFILYKIFLRFKVVLKEGFNIKNIYTNNIHY